jgi:hypothetical protein
MRYTNTVTPQILSSNEYLQRSISSKFYGHKCSLPLCPATYVIRTSEHCARTFSSVTFTVGFTVCLSVCHWHPSRFTISFRLFLF